MELALLRLQAKKLLLYREACVHFLVRLEQDLIDFPVFIFLPVLDIFYFCLHVNFMLLDFFRHFLEEGLLAVQSHIEDCFFKLSEAVIVAVKVVFENDHSLAILLRHFNYWLDKAPNHASDLCLKV